MLYGIEVAEFGVVKISVMVRGFWMFSEHRLAHSQIEMFSEHRLAHSQTWDEAKVYLVVLAQAVSHHFRQALVQNKQ